MGVPSNVLERINKLDNIRRNVEQRKRADRQEQARRTAVVADRNARRPLLLEYAVEIFQWRDDFTKSRDGQRLWSLIGANTRIYLFSDWFWEGLPIVADNALRAQTCVFLDGPTHHFLFEDWRDDDGGTLVPYHEQCRVKSPLEMVDQVHPSLIEQLQTHLSGPMAWQTILDELDRRLARYLQP